MIPPHAYMLACVANNGLNWEGSRRLGWGRETGTVVAYRWGWYRPLPDILLLRYKRQCRVFRSLQVEQDLGFFSDLGADPVMFMEMVSRIEDEFGKRVESAEAEFR